MRTPVGSIHEREEDIAARITKDMGGKYGDVSPVEYLSTLSKSERNQWFKHFTDKEIQAIEYYWEFWARPPQRFNDKYRKTFAKCGRGWGKTRWASETVRHWIETGLCRHVALIAPNAKDLRKVMVEDIHTAGSGILQVCPPWNPASYHPTTMRLTWDTPGYKSYGAQCSLYSGEEPDGLRGPAHDGAWIDEIARMQKQEEVWDMLMFNMRLGNEPRIIVTSTPKPTSFLLWLLGMKKEPGRPTPPDFHIIEGSTYDNWANLSKTFLEDVTQMYEGTSLGQQELQGQMLTGVEGALWDMEMIESQRLTKDARLPVMRRTVVGVDPQMSHGPRAMTGIVVASVSTSINGQPVSGYVLDDRSVNGSPNQWAQAVVDAYYDYECQAVVVERNQGGELNESNIHTVDPNVNVVMVTATKTKAERAIPIASKYEQKKIHHVGYFPDLEMEMMIFTPEETSKKRSPNRMDALVHALDHLLISGRIARIGVSIRRRI